MQFKPIYLYSYFNLNYFVKLMFSTLAGIVYLCLHNLCSKIYAASFFLFSVRNLIGLLFVSSVITICSKKECEGIFR